MDPLARRRAPMRACWAVLLACATPAVAQQPEADALADALAAIAPDAPGCAVAVERDGEVLAASGRGLADRSRGIPITPATVFYAGSVSKQFVATAVLLLVERGRLDLDQPVRRHIPELVSALGSPTLRQLLHHTGGVPDYLALATHSGRDWADRFDNREALAVLFAADSLQFVPGSAWRYSNGGYLLLAEVVARVSGRSFRSFADSALLAPLAMHDSHFHDRLDHAIADLATGYRVDSAGSAIPWPLAFAAVGSGGLYTTVLDLAKWSGNWWRNRLGDRDAALAGRLSTRGVLTSGEVTSYGMGVVPGTLFDHPVRRHGGGLAGYRASLLQFPELHLGIAVLCNSAMPGADAMAERVARHLVTPPVRVP